MSAAHTPGPWFVSGKSSVGSHGTSVWARGGDVRVADCNSAAISLPGRQCDARLIAAAPELLRVAELVVSWLDEEPGAHKLCDEARAAIAKATGATA